MFMKMAALACLLIAANSWATKDVHPSKLHVKAGEKQLLFSGYIDGYYAHDFSDPFEGEEDIESGGIDKGRDFTSNPLYDRQFSLGYGFFQVDFEHQDVAFRLAYHFGDIVQKMYFEEPERLKDIREASASVRLSEKLKVEVGYMPSLFGFETFINKDNMHATRAYFTDFAPDFDAGVRFYYDLAEHQVLKFQVTNGWQVERDKNKEKALGFVYLYEKHNDLVFNWGQFFGDESLPGVRTSYRWYNNIFAKIWLSEKWIVAPMLDLGWEQELHEDGGKGWTPWQSWGLSVRYAFTPKHGLVARYDRTRDPHNIIPELKPYAGRPMPHGWNSNGYTLTYEFLFSEAATIRVEGRYVKHQDAVFKGDEEGKFTDEDSFLLTALALSF